MPDELKLSGISLVMLGVKDMEKSVAFYRDSVGLTLSNHFPGFAFFNAGGINLVLSEPLARSAAEKPIAGAVELVFSVESVRKAYEGLQAKGIAFTHEPHQVNGPFWAANFDDPDGHHLSVFGNE